MIVILLAMSVTALTIDVWTYVRGGTKNLETPTVKTPYFPGVYSDMHDFAECDWAAGEYVSGIQLVREVDNVTVNARVMCESRGENNTFAPNNVFATATSRSCTSGPVDIMQNIALANFTADGSGVSYSCSGFTGCSGTTGCAVKAGFPIPCTSISNSSYCWDTDGDCRWDDDDGDCTGPGDCTDYGDGDETDCLNEGGCTWTPEPPCERWSSDWYTPDCSPEDRKIDCDGSNGIWGCEWGNTPCTNFNNDEDDCDDADRDNDGFGCIWGGTNCDIYLNDQVNCISTDGCSWNPVGTSDAEFGNGTLCPMASPIVVGVAGYNGEGTSYCPGDVVPTTTVTLSSLFNENVAGILPLCASADNTNCDYRYSGDGCFWYYDNESGREGKCPLDHYVSGVRGFVGDLGADGANIYIQSYCCSIEPINHTLEDGTAGTGTDGEDNDCDGLVDEVYYSPNARIDIDNNTCGASPCSINGITKDNLAYCIYEGNFYFIGEGTGGDIDPAIPGDTGAFFADTPKWIWDIDWDRDELACKCKFGDGNWSDSIDGWGTLTSGQGLLPGETTCCESGEVGNNEFFIPGRVDSRVSCCNDLVDPYGDRTVSIGGSCVQTRSYWADMQSDELVGTPAESDIGDSVEMRVANVELAVGTNVTFEVFEADGAIDDESNGGSNDDAIRSVGLGNEIIGVVDNRHNAVAVWKSTTDDMVRTNDYNKFYFRVKYADINDVVTTSETGEIYKFSNLLEVNQTYNDDPMTLTLDSPLCGEKYMLNDNVTIQVTATDLDNDIDGNVSIDGVVFDIDNGGVLFNHTMDRAGNVQVALFGMNDRGYMRRTITSIMIVDPENAKDYVAACISEPADYSDITSSNVKFNSSTSTALTCNGGTGPTGDGACTTVPIGDLWFSWRFSDGLINFNHDGENILSSQFYKNFATAGNNWAILDVAIRPN